MNHQSQIIKRKICSRLVFKFGNPNIDEVRLNFLNLTIFITPESSRSVLDSWDELKLLVKVFFIFYLILTISLLALGKWLRPIKTITETMTKVNEKGFDIKLPDFVIPDFQKYQLDLIQ